MTTNLLEKLNEARKNENAIKYMKGYELVDGKQVAQYEVTLIDIDVETAAATVFSEVAGKLKIETLKREDLIFRTA